MLTQTENNLVQSQQKEQNRPLKQKNKRIIEQVFPF